MRWIDDQQFEQLVHGARAEREHIGYLALQPIIDVLEVVGERLFGKRTARARRDEPKSRSSFPPPY